MKKQMSLLAVLLMSSSLVAGLASCVGNPTPEVKPTPTPSEQPSVQPSTPEASTPEVSTPEVSTPEVSTPEVSTPDETTPSRPDYGTLEFDTTKPVSIEIYTTLSSSKGYGLLFDDYLNQFQQMYPNITVTHTRVGGYNDVRDQLKTELGAGQGPNLAYCYPDHVALYNKARAVQTLDKFIYNNQVDENGNYLYGLSDETIDSFFDAYWEEGRVYGDGKMYTLPIYKSTEVLYYNVEVLEQAGLQVPTHWFKDDAGMDPTTSLEYACEVLKNKYPTSTPLGYDSESNWFITMAEQLGSPYTSATGENFLFDNETNRDFVKKFKGWYDKGYVTTQEIYGGYTSAIFTNTTDSTITRSFFTIGSSAGATNQVPSDGSFTVGTAAIPQVDPANPKAISQGPSLVMFKKADQQQVVASWLLMRFLTTNGTFQADFSASSGYIPCIESVFENEMYLEWLDSADGTADGIAASCVKTALDNSDSFFTSPAFVGSSDARDEVGALLQAAFLSTPDSSKGETIDSVIADLFENAIKNCKEG